MALITAALVAAHNAMRDLHKQINKTPAKLNANLITDLA